MIELRKIGRKTGVGWYRYPGGKGKVEDPIVADLANEEAHFVGRTRTDHAPADIRNRLLLAMINEVANMLYEAIAQSARDIDIVTVSGYSFPRWHGGLTQYADSLGVQAIVQKLEVLAKEAPIAWQISPLLRACAKNGSTLADYTA
tara:strand:- start:770 stop:1207 length:438 start_codon:yes stop_codon:yes gene_type:complete